MREIKFRTFIKDTKKMLLNNHSAMAVKMFTPNYAFLNSEVEVMQYTGLKDKNGKEIYEGDILKIPVDIEDSIHGSYSLHEVVYRNGTWVNQYLKSETGFKLPRGYTAGVLIDNYDHDMKMLVFNDDRLEHTEIEVVGNIYENEELLTA